jgi:exopolysaccharide biosynthesis polyprenyl glycosylphosphotransferase
VSSDVAVEGRPQVTTSLEPRVSDVPKRGRHRVGSTVAPSTRLNGASEYQPIPPNHLNNNGVPRSSWYRSVRRASTWHRGYALALVLLDFAAAAAASITTVLKFRQADSGFQHSPQIFELVAFVLLPLAWVIVLWGHGAYDRRYLGIGTDEFKRVFRASLTVTAIVSFLVFSTQFSPSRLTVGSTLLVGMVYVMLGRSLARRVLILVRGRGRAVHRVLLVGSYNEARDVFTAVSRVPGAGMVPVGILLTEGYAAGRGSRSPVPVYTGREPLGLVREIGADMIAVCGSASAEPGELRRLAWQIEGSGIDLVVAPQLTDIAGPRVHIRPVEGLPLLHVEEPKVSGVGWLFKNVLDRLLALVLLVVLAPLFALVCVLIWVSDRGPAFFRQTRVGREGQTFRVWKFRTMYTDAEERLAHLVDQNESDGLMFKMRRDPRVTPIGRLLRRTSIDEFPQLINVLVGEMSLVGPRPLPADDGDFLGDVRRRLLVRPGMTGLWQVSGRSELSWDDAVRLDLYYVDNWSLAFDLVIMWRTVAVVFAGKGAY